MDEKQLKQLFDKFNNYRVLVIGDVMIDSYLWGGVTRISPEAPVPVMTREGRENRLGGAANVALNVQALGAKPLICASTGNDEYHAVFRNLMEKRNMPSEGIMAAKERITTIKTRVISSNQHLLRIDHEMTEPLSAELEKQFIQHVKTLFANNDFDAVIFEDYDKGTLTPAVIEAVVTMARNKGILTLADPKKRNFMAYRQVSLFKPNFKELKEGLKTDIARGDEEALRKAAQRLKQQLQAGMIFVTLSELGGFIINEESHYAVPAEVRDITDVSGAGDTVISIAAMALTAGLPPRQIVEIANLGGGLVCEKSGVVPIDKKQLLNEAIAFYRKK